MANGIYIQKVQTNDISTIYTHDELPAGQRYVDQRSGLRKVIDGILGRFRNISFILESVPSRILTLLNYSPYTEYCQFNHPESWNKWKADSKGLYVFTHGFQGHRSIWDRFIIAARQRDPDADVRVPFVPEKGNCSLGKSTRPIRKMIKHYINEQIDKKQNTVIPIYLGGLSNGTRITLKALTGLIDDELDNRLKAKGLRLAIKVDAVAGVLRGTTTWVVRLANANSFTKWVARKIFRISPAVLKDFQYKSEASKQLIDEVRKINSTANIVFDYRFYASTEDPTVTPFASSLPVLGKGEKHYIVNGEGHSGIVKRVLPLIMRSNASWKESQEKLWNEHLVSQGT